MPYVPVTMGLGQTKNLSNIFGKNVAWWQKDAAFYHPFVLYSAHPHSKFEDLRSREEIGDDVTILCDSGGFQVYSMGIKLDKEKVFGWQLKNGDLNFCLDCPPRVDASGRKTIIYDTFEKSLNETYENSKWYARQIDVHRRANTLGRAKFVLISHTLSTDFAGGHVERLAELVDSYDAISVAYHGKDYWGFFSLAMKWRELLGDKKKDLHLLGMSGIRALPAVSLLRTIWPGRVTFDSSSVFAGGKYRTYWLNTTIDRAVRLRSGGQHKKMAALPCSCPYCSLVPGEVDLDAPGIGSLIALHNLFVITQRAKVWDWLMAEDPEEFKKFAKDIGAWPYLEFIDKCLNFGWARAIKSYWWAAGTKGVVKERHRDEEEEAIELNCFGNYDEEVCKGKCNLERQCKKVMGK